MSTTTQRRDQRRRLLMSWKRGSDATPAEPTSPRPAADYPAEARPERLPGPAAVLPTGLGGLALAACGILVPLVALVALGVSETAGGPRLFRADGRFAATVRGAAACLDPQATTSLQAWAAQLVLLGAAGVAWIVRAMRRRRRDDYRGRFRAWGWLAVALVVAACSGLVPLGGLVGAALADATGIVLGPQGIGWWFVVAGTLLAAIAAWAVTSLEGRAGTVTWLALGLGAWTGAAAATWLAAGRAAFLVAAQAAWTIGAGLVAVALLAAARSVIREVRGETPQKPRPTTGRKADATPRSTPARDVDAEPEMEPEPPRTLARDDADEPRETEYVDGSESEHRHLSKAERKRLRKLARMQEAGV